MSGAKDEAAAAAAAVPNPRTLSCTKSFDALWFCYCCEINVLMILQLPFISYSNTFGFGNLDNCSGKWTALVDCLTLKTKRRSEVEEILESREKEKAHIWSFRTPEEAASHWKELFGHLDENE